MRFAYPLQFFTQNAIIDKRLITNIMINQSKNGVRHCLIFSFLLTTIFTWGLPALQAQELTGYRIPNTVVHEISSDLTGSDYEILVWLPYTYDKVESKRPFQPVLTG